MRAIRRRFWAWVLKWSYGPLTDLDDEKREVIRKWAKE